MSKQPAVTGVRLPPEMRDRLVREGNLSDAIKRRLEDSFAWDAMDPPTRDLLATTLQMAGLIFSDTGAAWHANAYLRAALAEAIAAWLAERVPGDVNLPSTNASASIAASAAWLREGDTAQAAGEKLLRLYKLLRAPDDAMARYQERLRTNPLLRHAHEQSRTERDAAKGRKKS